MARRVTIMSSFPPMSTQEQDERLLNLAHAIARADKYKSHTYIPDHAYDWLQDWEEFQGKEYLEENANQNHLYEVRIHQLLRLLCYSFKPERQHLVRVIAHNINDYAHCVSTVPFGYFSKDIHQRVTDVLDPVL